MAKLISFTDLSRNSQFSTAQEHANVLYEKGKVLWGQWAASNARGSISDRTYREMNNAGKGCIVYAYDKSSMLLKFQVDRVLKKEEVLDEHLEDYIPKYYGIEQPVHYYLQISDIITADPSQAQQLILDASHVRLSDSRSTRINNTAPWNVHEYESDSNELLVPRHVLETHKNYLKTITTKIEPIETDIIVPLAETHTIYRLHHIDLINNPKAQYVGRTNNLQRRMREHFNPHNSIDRSCKEKYLYIVMFASGIENWTYEILEDNIPTLKEAREREAYWINYFDSYYGHNGLNVLREDHWLHE